MKPLRLEITAFGPFSEQVLIDFTELGDRSFFLINGVTGAGKSTVLDCICYALYGEASNAEHPTERLRSDFAQPETPTSITFDFSIGENKYRIVRKPEQLRIRKHGTGTAKETKRATFWKLQPGNSLAMGDDAAVVAMEQEKPLADGWSNTNQEIETLLGFDVDQFRRVILLPQGQFQKLLLDTTASRQAILESLFQVNRYSSIENALADRSSNLKETISHLEIRQSEQLKSHAVSTQQELESKLTETKSAWKSAETTTNTNDKTLKTVDAQLALARQVSDKFQRLDAAQTVQQSLLREKELIETKRPELDNALKAASLRDFVKSLNQRRDDERRAKKEMDLKAVAFELLQKKELQLTQLYMLESEKDSVRKTQSEAKVKLDFLVEDVGKLELATGAAAKALKLSEHAEQNCAALKSTLAQLQTNVEKATLNLAELKSLQSQLDAHKLNLEKLDRIHKSRLELDTLLKNVDASEKQHKSNLTLYDKQQREIASQQQQLSAMQVQWLNHQALLLADNLKPDQPCPVCGSLTHPAPVTADSIVQNTNQQTATYQVVTRDAVQLFQNNLDRLRGELVKTQTAIAKADAKINADRDSIVRCSESLGDNIHLTALQWQEKIQQCMLALELSRQADTKLPAQEKQLEIDREVIDKTELQLLALQQKSQDAESVVIKTQAQVKLLEQEVPAELRSMAAIKKAQEQAARQLESMVAAWEQAQKNWQECKLELAKAEAEKTGATENLRSASQVAISQREDFAQRLMQVGLADQSAYQQALRSDEVITSLKNEVDVYDKKVSEVEQTLKSLREETAELILPNLPELEQKKKSAENDYRQSLQQQTTLLNSAGSIETALAEIIRIDSELKGLIDEHNRSGKLALVARGQNSLNISFQRYVLGMFLDEVLAAASQRFSLMSDGRYILQRSQDAATGRKKSGLDIDVFDSINGSTRPVSTLSGGECFTASLAVALGLADVVQARAGGIQLQTIFIDEGFGMLSPDWLDRAIATLQSLQQNGRLVGIISHVESLKEMIRTRLTITQTNLGSTAKWELD